MDLLSEDIAQEIRSFLDIINIRNTDPHILATHIHYLTIKHGANFSFKRCQYIAEKIICDERKNLANDF